MSTRICTPIYEYVLIVRSREYVMLRMCGLVGTPTYVVLKVHKIENFFDSDFGICVISLLVMSKD